MSAIYDNWERLVAAVIRREEIWQLCHDQSTNPSVASTSSDFSSACTTSPPVENLTSRNTVFPIDSTHIDATHILAVWEKQYKSGVHITLVAFPDGIRFVKRVRFSRMGFEERQAVIWWFNNREKVYKRYNAWGGDARIRRPSVVFFSWSPLFDQEGDESNLVPEAETILVNSNPVSSDENQAVKTVIPAESEEKSAQAEEHNNIRASDLPETEKIALQELKQLVQEALNRHEFGNSSSSSSSPKQETKPVLREDVKERAEEPGKFENGAEKEALESTEQTNGMEEKPDEVFIWGVKLLEDEKTDTVLLKFLRARDFNVTDAFVVIKNTIQWRKEFGIDELLEEDLGSELERVIFIHGHSKEGHPVCYTVFGEFQDKELYQEMFSDEEKRQKFLRWRIQFLERNIRKLDFSPGGISTIVQVNDLKNSPGAGKIELRQVTNQALQLLQDYYPEFVAKQVFINTPRWYLVFVKMISPLLTERTKSKFVFAGPSLSMATLFKYVSAEQIPTQYGGVSKDGDFGTSDGVTEIVVKPSARHIEEFPVTEACFVSWKVRVVGWEVNYDAKFVPSTGYGRIVVIERMRRIGSTQEQVISCRYRVDQPGKVVVTITNLTS